MPQGSKLIDVSRRLVDGFPTWPGDLPYRRIAEVTRIVDRDCVSSGLTLSAHTGTHVDTPAHFPAPGTSGPSVEALDLGVLVGPARVVDARVCSSISASMVRALESCPGRVLFRTDNSGRAYDVRNFVALGSGAAEALVGRGCALVGIDGPSVDPVDREDLPSHRVLLDAGILVLEGLDLGAAEPGDYELLCLPLLLDGAEAAPARVVLRSLP
jgi:arylformamidase